jgi:hypothetical protein
VGGELEWVGLVIRGVCGVAGPRSGPYGAGSCRGRALVGAALKPIDGRALSAIAMIFFELFAFFAD